MKEGALVTVDEAYGFHNSQFETLGALYMMKGHMISDASFINIMVLIIL